MEREKERRRKYIEENKIKEDYPRKTKTENLKKLEQKWEMVR